MAGPPVLRGGESVNVAGGGEGLMGLMQGWLQNLERLEIAGESDRAQ